MKGKYIGDTPYTHFPLNHDYGRMGGIFLGDFFRPPKKQIQATWRQNDMGIS